MSDCTRNVSSGMAVRMKGSMSVTRRVGDCGNPVFEMAILLCCGDLSLGRKSTGMPIFLCPTLHCIPECEVKKRFDDTKIELCHRFFWIFFSNLRKC